MTPDRRTKTHAATRQEIITVAWKQIAENGASALSLRAIARAMEMTAPAIYRYFPDRDALVTDLIVEAFTSLGEALQAGKEFIPAGDHAGRLTATGIAYRAWAVAYPQRYELIFGTPLPGYEAPSEVTMPAAAQSLNVLIKVLDDAIQDGKLPIPEPTLASGELQLEIDAWRTQVSSRARSLCTLPGTGHLEPGAWAGFFRDRSSIPSQPDQLGELIPARDSCSDAANQHSIIIHHQFVAW